MLANGVIEDSSSPWCSPVVLVKKRDGSVRFCVDLRAVNSATQPVAYPLPRIDEALDGLSGARFFTTLDMTAGYWQVEIAPEDREKTAFSTGKGLHQFRKMAMGLRNAGATFQRLMELVLAGVDAKTCLVYLDDVVLFNKTERSHLETLTEVFECIRAAGLKLKPQKCFIGRKEVTFLGHHVTREGIRPDPTNIEKVLKWPNPTTEVEVKGFLGLCGYYSKFIPNYAEVSRPLREAANQSGALRWTSEMEAAFDTLKKSLASPPVLSLPTFKGTFRLYTDACNASVGSILTEEVDGEERVIAYDSKVLSRQQRRWPTYDKELWAVVHAVRRFRQYTTGFRFQVITDHKPLANIPKSIDSQRDGTGRRGRWATELSSFEFDVTVKTGTDHTNADALSRKPATVGEQSEAEEHKDDLQIDRDRTASEAVRSPLRDQPPQLQNLEQVWGGADPTNSATYSEKVTESTPSSAHAYQISTSHQTSFPVQTQGRESAAVDDGQQKLLDAQLEDPSLVRLRELWESEDKPSSQKPREELGEWTYLRNRWGDVTIEGGLIGIRKNLTGEAAFQVLVPSQLREDILKWVHEHPTCGHMGAEKTVKRLLQRFSWPGMCHQAKRFCQSCVLCQRRSKPTPKRQAPMVSEATSRPFERIALDITEMPVSSNGNKYALVIMDYFSKYVRIYPMKDQKATTVSNHLMDWVYDMGVPERLHSDQGPQFESVLFQELCKQFGIRKTRTTPYHPQSDGMVERFMRTLKDMVAKYTDTQGLTWDDTVKAYAMAYNSAIHSTTGYSPFFLVHGFEARLPIDVVFETPRKLVDIQSFPEERKRTLKKAFEDVRRATTKAAIDSTKRYNQTIKYTAYQVGDKVWIRDYTASVGGKPKLGMPYKGPGVIIQGNGEGTEVTYKVRLPGSKDRVIHHDNLKPFIRRPATYRSTQGQEDLAEQHGVRSTSTIGEEMTGGKSYRERTGWGGSQAKLFPLPPKYPPASSGGSDQVPEHERRRSSEDSGDTGSGSSPPGVPQEDLLGSEDAATDGSRTPSQETSQGSQGAGMSDSDASPSGSLSAQSPASQPEPQTIQVRDVPYDESTITPYVTRSGRTSIPVMKFQAGVSPTVADLKHKYELFLKRNEEGD